MRPPSACTIALEPPSIVIARVFEVALEPELLPDELLPDVMKEEPELPPPQAQSALATAASSATDMTRTDIGTPVRAKPAQACYRDALWHECRHIDLSAGGALQPQYARDEVG